MSEKISLDSSEFLYEIYGSCLAISLECVKMCA